MGLLEFLFYRRMAPAQFWAWFQRFAPKLDWPPIPPHLDSIGAHLRRVNEGLVFQIGRAGDKLALEISADGIRALIPAVRELVAAAPAVPGWEIRAFRQPSTISGIEMRRRTYTTSNVFFTLSHDGGGTNLAVFLPGFAEAPEEVGHIAFLLLDATVGELVMMTRFAAVEFRDASQRPAEARALSELPAALEN